MLLRIKTIRLHRRFSKFRQFLSFILRNVLPRRSTAALTALRFDSQHLVLIVCLCGLLGYLIHLPPRFRTEHSYAPDRRPCHWCSPYSHFTATHGISMILPHTSSSTWLHGLLAKPDLLPQTSVPASLRPIIPIRLPPCITAHGYAVSRGFFMVSNASLRYHSPYASTRSSSSTTEVC